MEYNEALGAGLVQQFYDNREQYRAPKSIPKAPPKPLTTPNPHEDFEIPSEEEFMDIGETIQLGAEWWAKFYNAEERPLEERVHNYDTAQSIEPTQIVKDVTDYAINSGAFDYEMQDLGINKEDLREGMLNIAKIESSGGHLSKEQQVSDTGAQGLFQVVESTARGVLEKGNYFGANAAKAAGTTLPKLRAMTRPELQKLLLNNDKANALFATAVIMQKIKHNKNKSLSI